MNRLFSTKSLAAVAIAFGAVAATSAAHARTDVFLNIGVQPAPVYVQPRPVYVAPRHVYVAPQPVYTPAPRHYGNWERRGPYGDRDRDGIANVYDRHDSRNQYGNRHAAHRYGPYGDIDRDGVRNQDDRDRDGDGTRNRFDRFPDDSRRY